MSVVTSPEIADLASGTPHVHDTENLVVCSQVTKCFFFFQHNYEAEWFLKKFFGGQISNAAMSILFTHFIVLATYLSRHVSASFGVNLGLHLNVF